MTITEQIAEFGGNYNVGYIGFTVTRDSLISQGIQWFEKWDQMKRLPIPAHTFIVTDKDETVEAFPNGVHHGTLSAYMNDMNVSLLVRRPRDYTPAIGLRIASSAKEHIGDSYGYWLIAAMAVTNSMLGKGLSLATRGWFGRRMERWADGKKSEICSELVARSMQSQPELCGIGVLRDYAATITPMELFKDQEAFEDNAVELLP